jgi:hypothetical protein
MGAESGLTVDNDTKFDYDAEAKNEDGDKGESSNR